MAERVAADAQQPGRVDLIEFAIFQRAANQRLLDHVDQIGVGVLVRALQDVAGDVRQLLLDSPDGVGFGGGLGRVAVVLENQVFRLQYLALAGQDRAAKAAGSTGS
jgi:hypothetical protein